MADSLILEEYAAQLRPIKDRKVRDDNENRRNPYDRLFRHSQSRKHTDFQKIKLT